MFILGTQELEKSEDSRYLKCYLYGRRAPGSKATAGMAQDSMELGFTRKLATFRVVLN